MVVRRVDHVPGERSNRGVGLNEQVATHDIRSTFKRALFDKEVPNQRARLSKAERATAAFGEVAGTRDAVGEHDVALTHDTDRCVAVKNNGVTIQPRVFTRSALRINGTQSVDSIAADGDSFLAEPNTRQKLERRAVFDDGAVVIVRCGGGGAGVDDVATRIKLGTLFRTVVAQPLRMHQFKSRSGLDKRDAVVVIGLAVTDDR
ncbi:hypothetical protein Poly51_43820 [Rubripirellula tenax]|uniref:Uncharacterized protein n=1 Tax=Rubripirellula tenax TaxID=2528015 RepID=A0A5C6EQ99_9BACT|nr:hypothetical protein Poly51_43820 [Rubripirellula tenax]